jgi:hypothetical protein
MHHSFARLYNIDERIIAVKVGIGRINDEPIFDRNDIEPEFDEAYVFIVVKNAELFSLTYLYVVV